MVKVKEDLTGKKFGLLTVVKQIEDYITPKGRHHDKWLCKCDCGKESEVVGYHLKEKNKIKSCGCYTKYRVIESHKKMNNYDLNSNEYGVGYTLKGDEFWFDKDDYDLIKEYCWRYNDHGYVVATGNNKKIISLHRLVMHADENNLDVDHKSHPPRNVHKKDNRKSNLEFVNDSQNSMNRAIRSDNKSGVTGVYLDKRSKKWVSNICIQGKRICFGYCETFEEAVDLRKKGELEYFGEHRYDAHNQTMQND